MENSRARSAALARSGSQTATSCTRSPRFRQAVRWYQLIIPAPASTTRNGLALDFGAIALSPESEQALRIAREHALAVGVIGKPALERRHEGAVLGMPRYVDTRPVRAPDAVID